VLETGTITLSGDAQELLKHWPIMTEKSAHRRN
jgi:hypothetical protein